MKRLALIIFFCLLTMSSHVGFGGNVNSEVHNTPINSGTGSLLNNINNTWTDPLTGMEFVWVSGGCFQMGTPEGGSFDYADKKETALLDQNIFISMLKVISAFVPVGCSSSMRTSVPEDYNKYTKDERPVHEVCLDGFWIGKYEVTQGQWLKITGDNPSHFKSGNNYPVEQVSWDNIAGFIKKLNKQSGKIFSLPTEAQWEFAARSGGKNETFSGGYDVNQVAWFYGNSGGAPHAVGTKLANGLGIYDMSGNLREWCKDRYARDAYAEHARTNPEYVSEDESRVIRGGSWYLNPCDVRCNSRGWDWSPHTNLDVGFRLVRAQ